MDNRDLINILTNYNKTDKISENIFRYIVKIKNNDILSINKQIDMITRILKESINNNNNNEYLYNIDDILYVLSLT
jgi:vacuolar-type H+-ATPase subunit E/Vma4